MTYTGRNLKNVVGAVGLLCEYGHAYLYIGPQFNFGILHNYFTILVLNNSKQI